MEEQAKGRKIKGREKFKRGCDYCLDVREEMHTYYCPYEECPYHVLDKYEFYEDYLASEDAMIGFQKYVAGRPPKRVLDPGGANFWRREQAKKRAEKERK